jgi:ABC-type multidrug transport system fused ATPase/permease subunit
MDERYEPGHKRWIGSVSEPIKEMAKETKVLKLLLPLLMWYRWAIPSIVVLGVLSSLAEGIGISLFVPLLNTLNSGSAPTALNSTGNQLVDALNQFLHSIPPDRRLWVVAAGIFVSIFLKSALSYAYTALYGWLDARISHRLRAGIFERLLQVDYRFLENDQSGKLFNTLATETWRTSQGLSIVVDTIITLCTLCVYTALLLLISWQLTLVVGVVMFAISLVVKLLTRRVDALGRRATEANSHLAERMVEGLWGMKVIRTFGRESYEKERFDVISERVSTTFMKLGLLGSAVNPIYEVLAAALLVVILLSTLSVPGNLPLILVFILVLYRLQPRIKAIDEARLRLISLAPAVENVIALLPDNDKTSLPDGVIPFRDLRDGIFFQDVTFSYNKDEKPALQNVSFCIPAGKTTALVGPSGAGKSTIIDLVLRFYQPEEGEVRLDDEPLRNMKLAAWRERVALVSQDVYLFNTTIGDNIAYGKLGATREEVIAAAKQADAHDFISRLPQGYDTPVGERGVRLSGGQKQRLTLARAIVRDPEVLILDEATNALDSISENVIQEALDQLSGTRTIILVAHRLATIERADHVIVLEEGQVREQGEFHELLALDGLFARLHRLQNRRTVKQGSAISL